MPIKLLLATKNRHKADEIKETLGSGFEILTMSDVGIDVDVVEDGATFEENAAKKAREIFALTGLPTLADDSGLEVDYLHGAPGVHTARYAGEHATSEENIAKLLAALDGVPAHLRGARFVCVLALRLPGQEVKLLRGECGGRILFAPQGSDGFGYDPVFLDEKYDLSFAQLPAHIKNVISHRAKALRKLRKEFV